MSESDQWLYKALGDWSSQLGPPRQAVDTNKLYEDYNQGLGTLLESLAQHFFGVLRPKVNLRLAKVRSGGPASAFAWVEHVGQVSRSGVLDARFAQITFTIYIRINSPNMLFADRVIFAFAHELSHIVMYTLGKIEHNEKEVDLLTMFFGFAEVRMNTKVVKRVQPPWVLESGLLSTIWKQFSAWLPHHEEVIMPLGYMTTHETVEALSFIKQLRTRPR